MEETCSVRLVSVTDPGNPDIRVKAATQPQQVLLGFRLPAQWQTTPREPGTPGFRRARVRRLVALDPGEGSVAKVQIDGNGHARSPLSFFMPPVPQDKALRVDTRCLPDASCSRPTSPGGLP